MSSNHNPPWIVLKLNEIELVLSNIIWSICVKIFQLRMSKWVYGFMI